MQPIASSATGFTTGFDGAIPERQAHLWPVELDLLCSEASLVATALALGAERIHPWAAAESALANQSRKQVPSSSHARAALGQIQDLIRQGGDPLGDAFCNLRSAERRREQGAVYTPEPIIKSMLAWASAEGAPGRVVDPGVGSARFLAHASTHFKNALLLGVDTDPLATIIARANLAVLGLESRSRILLADYRDFGEPYSGSTLYIGNPPYVRHHQIPPPWKEWLTKEAIRLGHPASQLAGLHIYFFLATALRAQAGDFGVFITSSEWLDVNYGALLRSLFVSELGGQSITLIDPAAKPFPNAATTAAITSFRIGSRPTAVYFRRVESLDDLNKVSKGRRIGRERLLNEKRWSHLSLSAVPIPEGYVELGELCRVHRGQVTGANDIWIAGSHSAGLPESILFPSVTRAKELIAAQGVLEHTAKLRSVIDLPVDLDELEPAGRKAVERFLKLARAQGADRGYVASHRRAWWSVGLKPPAPIISTYMARRAPAFVLNKAAARHINIAHGLYPRQPMSPTSHATLLHFLQHNVSQHNGRTYAGGLTKFEPREMERLIVPGPDLLASGVCG